MKSLKDQKILVIGGSSGMGLATAILAAEQGYQVVIASRQKAKLDKALLEIDHQSVSAETVDITDVKSIDLLFQKVGKIDHLIVAGSEVKFGDFKSLPIEDMQDSFNSKFFGPVRVVRAAVNYLNAGGSIVLFSGSAGAKPELGTEIISAINSAVEGFSRALSLSLAPIRVNTIAPGLIDTPVYHGMGAVDKEKLFSGFTQHLPLKQVGQSSDVAESALYLIKNNYTTGTTLYVDGGHALR